MKKNYIAPFVVVEEVQEEFALLAFSQEGVTTIGEGDSLTEEQKKQLDQHDGITDNENGDGLNAKGNTHFFGIEW